MEHKKLAQGPLPPEHPEVIFQAPINAVKIFLDRALAVIKENQAIGQADREWFIRYCHWMIEEIDPKWLTKQL